MLIQSANWHGHYVCGQVEITRDLMDIRKKADGVTIEEAEVTRVEGMQTDRPVIYYSKDGVELKLECDFVAGCDGFYGASRQQIPDDIITSITTCRRRGGGIYPSNAKR
ncbi:MAG: FAD-dependent monooxygenase [Alphaproteobacteria bacterium]|nr:FAD-dependent monooxygenase [Alphaproteobacteria bacterium]